MGILHILKKDLELFPPFMVEGDGLCMKLRAFYLQFSETLSSLIVCQIFINYIFFCGQTKLNNSVFTQFNLVISTFITIDVLCKLFLIRPLYFNRYYYGTLFVIFDLLSGPLSLTLTTINLVNISDVDIDITFSDLMILLRIFCLERIRLLIKDVAHILYVSRYINLALSLTFYVYSYFAYRMFQDVSPQFFRNIFVSMLSMFQVLTLDSWNIQVNQSVSSKYGQACSIFFVFFIVFMFFYFINLLLGAFVSYYSNPNLRINFDYDFDHDDILNPELNEEYKQTVEISRALQILDLKQDDSDEKRRTWGLGEYEATIYFYVALQLIIQVLVLAFPDYTMNVIYVTYEVIFGGLICFIFILKIAQFRTFKQGVTNNIDEKTVEEINQQEEEQRVRYYILGMLALSGPVALILDIFSISSDVNNIDLQYGPGFRVFVVLAVDCVQKAIFKFVEVFPGVSHILLFVAGILFSMCLIGHQFLHDCDDAIGYPAFSTMTTTYLFLLQVITFDSWGDVARVVIQKKGFLFVLYFLFLTIFIGFFLLNMLVGIMATMTQPKTQELFEKEHILRQRVNKDAVKQLKDQIEIHKKNQTLQKEDEVVQLKQILDDFNSSSNPDDKLYIYLGGQQYEITTKHFIVFDDDT